MVMMGITMFFRSVRGYTKGTATRVGRVAVPVSGNFIRAVVCSGSDAIRRWDWDPDSRYSMSVTTPKRITVRRCAPECHGVSLPPYGSGCLALFGGVAG